MLKKIPFSLKRVGFTYSIFRGRRTRNYFTKKNKGWSSIINTPYFFYYILCYNIEKAIKEIYNG